MKAPRVLMPQWRCQAIALIASFYTHIIIIMMNIIILLHAESQSMHRETQRVGNDRP